MILFTIGTSEPFDRLIEIADAVCDACSEDVLVQGGRSTLRFQHARFIDFLSYEDLVAAVDRARLVVTHAGAGSILLAMDRSRRPIVVPRLRRFGEAVDDHQLIFARRLHALGLVRLAEEPQEIFSALGLDDSAANCVGPAGLALALRAHIEDRLGPPGIDLRNVA